MRDRFTLALVGALVLTFLVDLAFSDPGYGKYFWSKIVGWDILFGFVGCLVLIFGAQALGKYLVQRPEQYYDQR